MVDLPKEPIQDLAAFGQTVQDLQKKCNVLSPVTKVDRLLPMHALALALVPINPSPVAGDIYHDKRWETDEYALTHVALNKLFIAAGGTWVYDHCGRVDDRTNSLVVEWTCLARMKDPTGSFVEAPGTKRVDLSDGSPETKGWTADRINEARRFIIELAESKAQNRAIRKLLGIRGKYKMTDIAKPFVVIRSVPLLDLTNPVVAEMATRFALGGTEALYGHAAHQEDVRRIDELPPREVKELPSHLANDGEDDTPSGAEPASPPTSSIVGELRLDFGNADKDTQLRTLAELMRKKDFAETKLRKPLADFSAEDRKSLFAHLQKLPDQPELPFNT